MTQPCINERAIDHMARRIERIEDKIDLLLADKWKRIGAVTVVAALVSVLVTLAGVMLK